ncbi:MAG: HAD-IA family hydrolase [Alphaproteobacteria bacterium]|nr:HAD-IA family hydrolase [Alphaproteobacteria bacterium]
MSIKYCVWDVGQTIYSYTLAYLDEWAFAKTTDKAAFQNSGGVKTFDYNPYMDGKINDDEFCKSLCEKYHIPFGKQTLPEINKAMHKGVGNFFEETIQTMAFLSQQGIENCILSNALPLLSGTAPAQVKEKYRFASFDLKLLKPDPRIYQEVRRRLDCRFDEMIFIDDKEKNVQSAVSLGIHGIVFDKATIKNKCETLVKTSGAKGMQPGRSRSDGR